MIKLTNAKLVVPILQAKTIHYVLNQQIAALDITVKTLLNNVFFVIMAGPI